MGETADVVIVGAGIIGLSIAHQILRRSSLKVVVVDKGVGPGEGSTGASSAVCRFRYSNDEMVLLARDGVHAYRNWNEFVGIADPVGTYNRQGNLWFSAFGRRWAKGEAERLGRLGVRASVLDDASLAERFPLVSRCISAPDLETGADHEFRGGGVHFLEEDAGYMDPMAAVADLLVSVRSRGAKVRFNSEVVQIQSVSGKAMGVRLKGGACITAGTVVNAAGPWGDDLFRELGLNSWPLVPTRIQIVHIDCPPEYRGRLPICGDLTSGIYFREQVGSKQIIVGSVLETDEQERVADPDHFDRSVDQEFVAAKLHALSHRLPGISIRGVQGYSGLYTINASDVHPIVGETALAGFYAANGCSGHGFKLAPSIGAMIARAVTGNADAFDTQADPAFLAVDRRPISVPVKSALA